MAIPFPEIDPIAIHFTETFGIRWYALAYLAGIIGGWFYASKLTDLNEGQRPNRTDIENILPWIIMGVILGGRLGYVFFYNFMEYMERPMSIFYIWEGGMSFHGGILGVISAIAIYSWKERFSLLAFGDVLAVVAPIGLFFGRIANFINGELFGRVTTVPWAVNFPYGGSLPRHPSQLYEALLEGLLLFIIMHYLSRKKAVRDVKGVLSGVFIAGYGLSRFVVEFYREPDVQIGFIFNYFSLGQFLSLPMIFAGLYLIYYARKQAQPSI